MLREPFYSEPSVDFSVPENRTAMQAALRDVEKQLGKRYPLIIGGQRRETGQWFKSINPGNLDQVVGEVALARKQDVDDAIEAAEKAFKTWRNMSAEGRASVNFRMAGILRRRRLELSAWMALELDKAWDEADGEVAEAIDLLEFYGREMLRLDGPVPGLSHLPDEATEMFYQPLGVGVVIPPWNFPCAILVGMTMAGVVSGNAVVLKPAQQHAGHRLQAGRDHGRGGRSGGCSQLSAWERSRDRRPACRSPAYQVHRVHWLERYRRAHL